MLIAIDHGNKQIKTTHKTFSSGLCESDTRPPFGENVLYYNGKYYTLSDQRIPYMRDKTKDERFFVLTLFAIASELKEQGRNLNHLTTLANMGRLTVLRSGELIDRYADLCAAIRRLTKEVG